MKRVNRALTKEMREHLGGARYHNQSLSDPHGVRRVSEKSMFRIPEDGVRQNRMDRDPRNCSREDDAPPPVGCGTLLFMRVGAMHDKRRPIERLGENPLIRGDMELFGHVPMGVGKHAVSRYDRISFESKA